MNRSLLSVLMFREWLQLDYHLCSGHLDVLPLLCAYSVVAVDNYPDTIESVQFRSRSRPQRRQSGLPHSAVWLCLCIRTFELARCY